MWTTPLPNRRSSRSLRLSRTSRGSPGLPPPTKTGKTNSGGVLHAADSVGIELALEPGAGCPNFNEHAGVDDLVECPPHLSEVGLRRRQSGFLADRLPDRHRLVHAPAVEAGTNGPFELVDERMHTGVGNRPINAAVGVFDVAVQRRDRGADELGHDASGYGSGPTSTTVAQPETVRPGARPRRRTGHRRPQRQPG